MDHNQISQYLQRQGADWITWIRNPLTASHMRGRWERWIRTARSILNVFLKTHRNYEDLHILPKKVGAILNSQPMKNEAINDVQSQVSLFPSNLLTVKWRVVMIPPGSFGPTNAYYRKRWRRTQYIINEFWARWRKEFIQTLQEPKSGRRIRRNFQKGDVVLLKAEYNQNN